MANSLLTVIAVQSCAGAAAGGRRVGHVRGLEALERLVQPEGEQTA